MRQNVDKKAAEALKQAGGSHNEALKILLAEAMRDFELLKDMTRPFLRGIGSYAIERAKNSSPDQLEADAEALQALEKSEEAGELGAELVRTILSKTGHTFGTQPRPARGSAEAKPIKASAKHESIMRALARKEEKKK